MAKTIPIVRLEGVIATGGLGGAKTLSLAGIEPALKDAFDAKAPAVALVVNSPGGSPVQSSLIGKRIRQLAAEHKKTKVIAFVEDVAASGGYWLACAADEIIVDENSIVGSIGVISAGFGLQDAIARIGVERRVYTAGQSKSQLDPFQPEKPEQIANLKSKLEEIHQSFIAHVKARRGAKLKETPGLFEGEFYVGATAVRHGLADAVGDLHNVLADRYGAKVKLKPMRTRKPSLVERLFGAQSDNLAFDAASGAIGAAEARALWARYGL